MNENCGVFLSFPIVMEKNTFTRPRATYHALKTTLIYFVRHRLCQTRHSITDLCYFWLGLQRSTVMVRDLVAPAGARLMNEMRYAGAIVPASFKSFRMELISCVLLFFLGCPAVLAFPATRPFTPQAK